tara:strand:- start:697897 stop:700047 length:2151 start_codon:yes stop_codon:yes gene_type:complete
MYNDQVKRLRLATLVTIGVCVTVVVTMLSLLFLVNHFARAYAVNQAEERLQQLSWQMRDALDRGLNTAVDNMQLVSHLAEVQNADDPQALRTIFDQIKLNFPDYAWIGLADNDGKVIAASAGMLEGEDVSQRPWFQQGKNGLVSNDYHPAVLLEKLLPYSAKEWRFVDVALPVKRDDGPVRGVLAVHLSWQWARKLASDLLIPADNQYMVEVLIVREDGLIIRGPDYLEETTIDQPSFKMAQSGFSGSVTEKWPDGRYYLTSYTRTGLNTNFPSPHWSVLIRQPKAFALIDFGDLERRILFAGGLIALLLMMISVWLARRLAKPLDELSAAILQRRGGNFARDIPITDGYHEVHLLSSTLAEMVKRERQHVTRLHSLNENLENLVQARTQEMVQKASALEAALAQQLKFQELLQDSEAELRATLQNANDAFIAMDQNGTIINWNEQAERQLGWTRNEAIGKKMAQMIIPPAMRDAHLKGMQHFLATGESKMLNRRIEITALRRDGVEFPVELNVASVPRHDGHLFIAFLHDITDRQNLQTSLTNMALHDMLTNLPNRRVLMQKLPECMARTARLGKSLAIFFLDLDGFKSINDEYGHEAGDELLLTVAQRMVGAVRTTDTVIRLAGDEFVVILEMMNGDSNAIEVAEKVLHAIKQPFTLKNASVNLSMSASIGIVLYQHGDKKSAAQLLTQADAAMYEAKRKGKNKVVLADRDATN